MSSGAENASHWLSGEKLSRPLRDFAVVRQPLDLAAGGVEQVEVGVEVRLR